MYIQVGITPHKIHKDTVFVGNPHLKKHHNLLVSDFPIKQHGKKFVQVTNTGTTPKIVSPDMKLAVDDGYEDVFFDTLHSLTPTSKQKTEFSINPKLSAGQQEIARTLLQNNKDVGVYDVSELGVKLGWIMTALKLSGRGIIECPQISPNL